MNDIYSGNAGSGNAGTTTTPEQTANARSAAHVLRPPLPTFSGAQPQPQSVGAQATPPVSSFEPKARDFSATPFWLGVGSSALWIGIVVLALIAAGDTKAFAGIPLSNWALGVSAITAPVAFIWMVAAYLQRASDVQSLTEPLRRTLSQILNEQGAAEGRIRRFNAAIKQQLELIRQATSFGQNDFQAMMDRLVQEKNELVQIVTQSQDNVSTAMGILQQTQEFDRRVSERLESLRLVERKFNNTGENVTKISEHVRQQLEGVLGELSGYTTQIEQATQRAASASAQLQDTVRSQETDLIAAADRAGDQLKKAGLALNSDMTSIEAGATAARQQIEAAVNAMKSQAETLTNASRMVPERAAEAERRVKLAVEALMSGETTIRAQTEALEKTLSTQGTQLQTMFGQFGAQVQETDQNLVQRRSQLEALVNHVGAATQTMGMLLDGAIERLQRGINDNMEKMRGVTTAVQEDAAGITQRIAESTGAYEAAATRVENLTATSGTQLNAITDRLSRMVLQLEAVDDHTRNSGNDLAERTAAALMSLQDFQRKMEMLREQTTMLADQVLDRLQTGAQAQQQVLVRLSDQAQDGVSSLGMATETLVRHSSTLVDQMKHQQNSAQDVLSRIAETTAQADNGFKLHLAGLTNVMNLVQEQLHAADQRLGGFATTAVQPVQMAIGQIEKVSQQGMQAMSDFGRALTTQQQRFEQTAERLKDLGMTMDVTAQKTAANVEDLSARLNQLKDTQMMVISSAQQQFEDLAARLAAETGNLGQQAQGTATRLTEASGQVQNQVQQLTQTAQQGAMQLQSLSGSMQTDTAHMRGVMQKQAADWMADLAMIQAQFVQVGDTLKARTDEAFMLIERMNERFEKASDSIATTIDARAKVIETSVDRTQANSQQLSAILAQKLDLIDQGNQQMQEVVAQITNVASRMMGQMESLTERSQRTHESVAQTVMQNIARLDEANLALQRHTSGVNEGAQTAVISLQRAGSAMGEQANRLMELTSSSDQQLRSLAGTAGVMAEHAANLRSSLEQQTERLSHQIKQTVAQLDAAGETMQQTVATALMGAEESTTRFGTLSQKMAQDLAGSADLLQRHASQGEISLQRVTNSLTMQAEAIERTAEQIARQQLVVQTANDAQRQDLITMFERLATAHQNSAEQADRTMARLGEVTGNISRQLGQFTDQTQGALSAIRQTGGSLGEQANTMLAAVEQTEAQVRAVMNSAAVLGDQMRGISDQAQTEARRAAETMATVLGQLDGGVERMRLQSSEITTNATRAQEALSTATAQMAEQRTHVDNATKTLSEGQQRLAMYAAGAQAKLAELQQQFSSIENGARVTTDGLAHRLSAVSETLRQELADIAKLAEDTTSTVATASDRMSSTEMALRKTATNVAEQMQQLMAHATGLETATSTSTQSALQASGQISDATRLAQQALHQIGAYLAQTSDQATQTIADWRRQIEEQTQGLRRQAEVVAFERQKSNESAHKLASELEVANQRLAHIQGQTEQVTGKLAASFTDLHKQSGSINDMVGKTTAALAKQVQDLGGMMTSAQQQLQTTATSQREQAERIRAIMQTQVDTITSGLAQMVKQSEGLQANLRTTAKGTLDDIVRLGAQQKETTQLTLSQWQNQTAQLREVSEQASALLSGFSSQIDTQLDRMAQALEALQQQDHAIGAELSGALKNFSSISQKLEESRHALFAMGEQLASRIGTVGEAGVQHLEQLVDQAENAGKLIRSATAEWEQTTQSLAKGALMARGEVLSINHAMDALQQKADTMRGTLQSQGEGLITTLTQIMAQLEAAGDQIQYSADPLVARIEGGLKKIS